MIFKLLLFVITLLVVPLVYSAEKIPLRIGVLAFGTVNWELAILKNQHLLDDNKFELKIHPVANPQAGKIALQSGAVDVIVADWIWVSRMRSTGSDFSFYPYSNTSGALIIPPNSKIQSINDLAYKTLGIAGGELDKNWLLLQALAQQQYQLDLKSSVEKVYGAPPLLNQQILRDRVDAIINYWHFAAKLEAQGYKQLISGQQILQQLGITAEVPTLGYVFNRSWATQHKTIINDFLKATQQAKNQLCDNDATWQHIIPLTRVKDLTTQNKLRQRYCQGRVKQWGVTEQQAAAKIYTLLRQFSQNKLTGNADTLQTHTFWTLD